MGTQRISVVNESTREIDGGSYYAPYTFLNSGSSQDPNVLVFTAGVVSGIKGSFRIPENYVDTPVLSIPWTAETTTGDVDFKFRHRTTDGDDTDRLDISTFPDERADAADGTTGPTSASRQMITTISLTATDLVAGSMCYYEFERDGVSDTKADDISIWGDGPHFQYADA